MSEPTDFYDDVNQQQLYALDRLCGLPDFVKKAEIEEDLKSLPDSTFADPINRKFPCHTKAATYLANAYFQQAKPLYPKDKAGLIQGRLEKYAEYWKIKSLVSNFNTKWVKIASYGTPTMNDSDFALVYEADGQKIRRMSMPNAVSVKMAGEYLYANRHMYTYPMRKFAARRILAKAMDYDERFKKCEKVAGTDSGMLRFEPDTQEYLERAAGFGSTHPRWAAEKIAQRVVMLGPGNKEMKVKLAELCEYLKGLDEAKPAYFQKLAEVIDNVDRATGLSSYYNHGVEMPEEMFFKILEKEAESILDNYITLQTGKSYPIDVFLTLPLEKISAVLGKDFADAVSTDDKLEVDAYKFASIAPTLPRGDAALLEQAIGASANEPHEKTARRHYGAAGAQYNKAGMIDFFKKQGKAVEDASAYSLAIRAKPQRPEDLGAPKTASEKHAGIGDMLGRSVSGGTRMLGEGVRDFLNALDKGSGQKLIERLSGKGLPTTELAGVEDKALKTLGTGTAALGGALGYNALKKPEEKPAGGVLGTY